MQEEENDPSIDFTPAQLSDPEKAYLPARSERAQYGADALYDADLKVPPPVAQLTSKRSFVTPAGRRFIDIPMDGDEVPALPKTRTQRIRASIGDFGRRLPQLAQRV